MKSGKNIIIVVLSILLIIMTVIAALSLKGIISLDANKVNEEVNNNVNDNLNEEVNGDNTVIENYLGKWYLGFDNTDAYSNVNIKKIESEYFMDILVNKEADYNNLKLSCADNSGVCYVEADNNHHFSIVMANEMIFVVPDYSLQGTYWNFASK